MVPTTPAASRSGAADASAVLSRQPLQWPGASIAGPTRSRRSRIVAGIVCSMAHLDAPGPPVPDARVSHAVGP